MNTIEFGYCLEKPTASLAHLNIPEPKIGDIISSIQDADIFMKVSG